jgi:hypothetical protein
MLRYRWRLITIRVKGEHPEFGTRIAALRVGSGGIRNAPQEAV